MVGRETAPGSSEAGEHLVEDQQHAVAVADLAHQRPVIVLGSDGATDRGDDGLPDHGGDTARSRVQDRGLDLGRGSGAAVRMGLGPWAAVAIGRPNVRRLEQHRLVHLPPELRAADGERPERRPVVVRPARDEH